MSTRIDIFAAIKKRWDSMGLGSTFVGGIWRGTVPPKTAYPYVSLVVAAPDTVSGRSSSGVFTESEIQFSIFYKAPVNTDPVTYGGQLLDELDGCFNSAPLDVPASAGQILNFQWLSDNVEDEPEEDVYHAWASYKPMAKRKVDFNPI